MADPVLVDAVIEELGVTTRNAALMSRPTGGVAKGDLRAAVSAALDAGMSGPQIKEVFAAGVSDVSSVAALKNAAKDVRRRADEAAKVQQSYDAKTAVGFDVPAPSGFGGSAAPAPSAPSGYGTRTAFDMLKESYPDVPISITRDGIAIVRDGNDDLAYDISGPSPVIVAQNGKAIGGGGTGGSGGVDNSLGWSQLGESQRQFDASFAQGKYEFQTKFDRSVFADDRAYQQAQDQYAKNFAENARQFDTSEAGQNRRFDAGEAGLNARSAANIGSNEKQALLAAQQSGFNSVNTLAPALGNLALDNARFVADTYSKPSDFLYRAQATRGVTPTSPLFSQADTVNRLSRNITDYNTLLASFNPGQPAIGFTPAPQTTPFGGTTPAPVVTPPAPAPTPAPAAAGFGGLGDLNAATASAWQDWAAKYNAANTPKMAHGGFTTAPKMVVGDPQQAGTPNPEIIENPTGAPITVTPMNGQTAPPQGQQAGFSEDPEEKERKKKSAALVKAIGFVDDPALQHKLVDEMAQGREKEIPHYAYGTITAEDRAAFGAANPGYESQLADFARVEAQQSGFSAPVAPAAARPPTTVIPPTAPAPAQSFGGLSQFNWSAPQLPSVPTTTQAELQALERSVRPPAISSILNGEMPTGLNLGFSLPTPQMYNSLTPDEKTAFGTTLATQYNVSPTDFETAIKQRFGRPAERSTARVVGF